MNLCLMLLRVVCKHNPLNMSQAELLECGDRVPPALVVPLPAHAAAAGDAPPVVRVKSVEVTNSPLHAVLCPKTTSLALNLGQRPDQNTCGYTT